MIFLLYGAPDVAMTQLLVEILFVVIIAAILPGCRACATPQLLKEGVLYRGPIGVEHQVRVVPSRSNRSAGDAPEVNVCLGNWLGQTGSNIMQLTRSGRPGHLPAPDPGQANVRARDRTDSLACSVSCGVPLTSWQRKVVNLTVPKS